MPPPAALWAAALSVRLVSALITGTFFSPDEYWQCGEVAHRLVFGYGVLTWEWTEAIRPALPVLPFAALYALLRLLRLDSPAVLAQSPLILQALFAAAGDVAMHRAAHRLAGPTVARWTFALHLTSPFLFYAASRPFSNSLEMVLVQIALSLWPWPAAPAPRTALALCAAALSIAVRPTAALVWLPLGLTLLFSVQSPIAFLFKRVFPILAAVCALSMLLDCWLYGRWVCVACGFVRFNATHNMAARYGVQPWHWYFTGAAPVLLGLVLPLFPYGVYLAPSRLALFPVALTTIVLSLNPHKEFRFLLPILPITLYFVAFAVNHLVLRYRKLNVLLATIMILSLVTGCYLATIHQRGPLSLMHYLTKDKDLQSLLLLMPCHSTPLYSHLHQNISIKSLDCSPALWASFDTIVEDEADVFYQNPLQYLNQNFNLNHSTVLPSHVAFFSNLFPLIHPWLTSCNYKKVYSSSACYH